MRFLGLELADAFPDTKTIWLFREQLTRAGAIEELFSSFDAYLKAHCYLAMSGMSGQIIDATIVAAPRQRNEFGGDTVATKLFHARAAMRIYTISY